MNWRDLKTGDRVRITLEGEVLDPKDWRDGGLLMMANGGITSSAFTGAELEDPTARVKRLDPPLKVGDRVTDSALHDGVGWRAGVVVGVHDGHCWVDFAEAPGSSRALLTVRTERLRRLPDAP